MLAVLLLLVLLAVVMLLFAEMLLQEIVDLIENLESACIRFVHFSKENELRSRVSEWFVIIHHNSSSYISLFSIHLTLLVQDYVDILDF